MDEQTEALARHGIGAVARRTGLTIERIRIWERRYGVVTPDRDGSGRRVYTDADVQRLRLLGQATKAGYAIGQVATLSAAALRALLEPPAEPGWLFGSEGPPPAESAADVERALARVRALDGEGLKGVLVLSAALLGTFGFVERVAAPLMRRIGDAWHAGRLTIAGEHLATGIVRSQLAQLSRGARPACGRARCHRGDAGGGAPRDGRSPGGSGRGDGRLARGLPRGGSPGRGDRGRRRGGWRTRRGSRVHRPRLHRHCVPGSLSDLRRHVRSLASA